MSKNEPTPAEKLAATLPSPRKRGLHFEENKLREVREKLRLSCRDVSRALGMSTTGYWQVEQGCDVLLSNAFKIAIFYGKTIQELWP